MFQSFETLASPEHGAGRLAQLRAALKKADVQGLIVPRADVHQGEYVAERDQRLQWLTGFTGSAGLCVVLPDVAGVFVDGRYRTQVKSQVDLAHFTPVDWPETQPGDWIKAHLTTGRIGYDPWLHTPAEVQKIEDALAATGVKILPAPNFIDQIWADQPAAPQGKAFVHPLEFAGESHADKRARMAAELAAAGQGACVITLPDSLCWLLNIRGADVPRNPVMLGLAILHADGRLDLFADAAKFDDALLAHLGPDVTLHAPDALLDGLSRVQGKIRLCKKTAPLAVGRHLTQNKIPFDWGDDPCQMAKACKNAAEIEGMRSAHLRDAVAMVEFLAWLDGASDLTEIAVAQKLEGFRRATNALHDLSFDSIVGSGPNGAIMHYRVTEDTNRPIGENELLLVDSGGQYVDGTTDITRTVARGDPGQEARECYTRVLQGTIAISRLRFAKGRAGRDLDGFARWPLWQAGMDFDHGTGHGVGAFLSVHEGPQRLSYTSDVPFRAGMILSNEPGYYREGEFGIRLENLIVVVDAPPMGDHRPQLAFETLTWVPFDRRLVVVDMLTAGERDWLNSYHAEVRARLEVRVSAGAVEWLRAATAGV
ncbi:aminopeptidase P family protein [Neogemmobacter tilapiae]|uniref:Xaa-Pro aminopeptidase n=1 Tax=Neogemmobacter tilapiae TaxID=875041 RepID=A0A918TTF6_9RHOB|nr:aminopeptidase P family protein [Gemmobacter tilapiae]GHC62787.1 Xaa-Pro aminopeptidase [Gemmobacter tilapiae]